MKASLIMEISSMEKYSIPMEAGTMATFQKVKSTEFIVNLYTLMGISSWGSSSGITLKRAHTHRRMDQCIMVNSSKAKSMEWANLKLKANSSIRVSSFKTRCMVRVKSVISRSNTITKETSSITKSTEKEY